MQAAIDFSDISAYEVMTARVDIAAFGRNPGTGWGAPTYISFSVIDKDAPYYDPALVPRIEAK